MARPRYWISADHNPFKALHFARGATDIWGGATGITSLAPMLSMVIQADSAPASLRAQMWDIMWS